MLSRTGARLWYLSFNKAAKARPNFGLKGVGYYSAPNYDVAGETLYTLAGMAVFMVGMYTYNKMRVLVWIDSIAGGGPVEFDYGQDQIHAAPPWHFEFAIGEGYANGEPKYRETGIDLEH